MADVVDQSEDPAFWERVAAEIRAERVRGGANGAAAHGFAAHGSAAHAVELDDSMAANPEPPTLLPVVRVGDIPEPGPITWLIQGLWVSGAFGLVGALPKSWKSYLTLHLAICVSTGRKVFDRFETTKGRVLIFSAEGGKNSVRRRVGALCRAMLVDLAELDFEVIDIAELKLDDPKQLAAFLATVAARRPALVIADPFRDLHTGDENDSKLIASLLGPLRQLTVEVGCALMLVHHNVKSGGLDVAKRRPAERLRGSGALAGAFDSALFLEASGTGTEKRVEVQAQHRDAAEPEPFKLRFRKQTGEDKLDSVWLEIAPEETDEELTEKALTVRAAARKKVLRAITQAALPGNAPLTNQKAIAKVAKVRPAAVSDALTELLGESLVAKDSKGAYRPSQPPENQ